jgi:peroxiredoxin
MRNYFNEDEDLDCSLFGISTESPLVVAAWRKDLRRLFALLSDYEGGVCRDYQCLYDEFGGFKDVSRRAA